LSNGGLISGAFSSDTTISTPVAINKGGTGQTTAQAALDALAAASGTLVRGDILIVDSSLNLVRLARGSDNQTLMINGSDPNWETVTGGGGNLVFVGQTVLGVAGGTIQVAFTGIAQADVSKMVLVLDAPAPSQNSQLRINEIDDPVYSTEGVRVEGGVEVIMSGSGETSWEVFNNNLGETRVSYIEITSSRSADTAQGNVLCIGGGTSTGGMWAGLGNSATVTEYNDFTALCNGGDSDFDSGSVLTVYRVNDS